MNRRLVLLASAAVFLAPDDSFAQETVRPGEVLEGRLSPAGTVVYDGEISLLIP